MELTMGKRTPNSDQSRSLISPDLLANRNSQWESTISPTGSSISSVDVIMENIFGFLKLREIKKCRLVCRRWNALAEPLLRKRSVVSLSYYRHDKYENHTPANFRRAFSNCQTNLDFFAMRFQQPRGSSFWPAVILEEFLDIWGKDLTTLYLDNVTVTHLTRARGIYNMSPTIQNNLTTLEVACDTCEYTCFKFSVSHLNSIKFLKLSCAILDIGNGIKLAPKEISLNKVRFCKNRRPLENTCVNDFVDFSNITHVSIHHQLQLHINNQAVSLNMEDNVTVHNLSLAYVSIVGAANVKWNVQKATFHGIPWLENNQIQITELNFENSILDLSTLPSNIVKLSLKNESGITARAERTFLANLSLEKMDLSSLMQFEQCPRLTELKIYSLDGLELLLGWIPSSVRRIELTDCCRIKIRGDGLFELETLVLHKSSLYMADKVMQKLRPRFLVIDISSETNLCSRCAANIDYCKQISDLLMTFNVVIFLGPLKLQRDFVNHTFDNSIEYWKFENRKGKPILYSDFLKVLKFQNVSHDSFQRISNYEFEFIDDECINLMDV